MSISEIYLAPVLDNISTIRSPASLRSLGDRLELVTRRSEHTFRRWRHRFEDDGEAGLLHRRLGRASGKRVPGDQEHEVEAVYRTRYSGFTAQHFHDHLVRDHQFTWGYTWTKAFLQSKGLLVRTKRREAHRPKRLRRPLPG